MAGVLLIRPLCEGDEPEFAEPLGIERLAGYLRVHGVPDVRVVDRRLPVMERRAGIAREAELGFYDTLKLIYPAGSEPQLVGLSLMTVTDVPDARRIVNRLHSWWPKARFVVGGVLVTGAPDVVATAFPPYVTLLPGEGESLLLSLAQGGSSCMDGGFVTSVAPPRNVCSDIGDDAARQGDVRGMGSPTVSPDDWAVPFRPDLERYAALGCAVNMQTSRGCPGRCAFCATPGLPGELRRWQPRSSPLVVDEIQREAERLLEAGLSPVFNFVDDDFGSLERLEDLADELDRRDLHVACACEMRFASLAGQPNLASRLQRLHEAGLTRVFFGIESLNPDTLAWWRKPLNVQALPDVLQAFRQAHVAVQVGYILWHSRQTIEGACEEVRTLHDLGIYSHRAALSRLIAFPGCALAAEGVDAQGFQPMDTREEAFIQRFAEEAQGFAGEYIQHLVAEPYQAACAFLTGDETYLKALKRHIDSVNEQSYDLFMRLSQDWGPRV